MKAEMNYMKTFFYTGLTAIALFFSGCGQSELVISEEKLTNDIVYAANDTRPFTGKGIVFYRNSEKKHYEFSFKNGILNGPFVCYYTDGKIKCHGTYKDGEFEGNWIAYNEEGQTLYNVTYQNGNLVKK